MAKPLVTDELWEMIGPLVPDEPPKPKGRRPRIPNPAALSGILFVLKTGTFPGRCSPRRRWAAAVA